MKYRARSEPSDVILPLELADGFTVQVRYISRQRDTELQKLHSRKERDPLSGRLEDRIDWPKYMDAYFAECVAGGEISPAALEGLVEFAPDSPRPEPNGNGNIPLDAELATFLRKETHVLKFEKPVWEFSRDLLEAERLQREARAKNSGA